MDPSRVLAWLIVAVAGSALVFWAARRLNHDPVLNEIEAWGKRGQTTVRGDGYRHALEVVGMVGSRWYTVAYDANAGVMLIGIDCAAHPGAPGVQEETLVSRWTRPTIEQVRRLDAALVEMATLAAELEAQHPGGAAEAE
jgi:hypothetical protein